MLIQMLETRRGSEDGHTVRLYDWNQQYDVTESLAWEFIRKGYAKPIPTPKEAEIQRMIKEGWPEVVARGIWKDANREFYHD